MYIVYSFFNTCVCIVVCHWNNITKQFSHNICKIKNYNATGCSEQIWNILECFYIVYIVCYIVIVCYTLYIFYNFYLIYIFTKYDNFYWFLHSITQLLNIFKLLKFKTLDRIVNFYLFRFYLFSTGKQEVITIITSYYKKLL